MKIVPIDRIQPYEKNAKKHPKKQVEQIAKSIVAFGFNQPIVVDKQGTIIVGHGRYCAAQALKITEVPVITLDIDEKRASSYRLADNKLNESDWDMKLVIEELKDLEDIGLVDLTGFSRDLVLDDDEKDDETPELPVEAESKRGQLYRLGRHRLLCGDSTSSEDVQKLMAGASADMVFTDPPYNVNYKGTGKNTSEGIKNDHMTPEQFTVFLDAVFKNYRKAIKDGAPLYVFHSTSTQAQFEESIRKAGMEVKNQLIWNKPTASLGWGDYQWKHEPFFYCGVEGVKIQFYGDRTNKTIWDFQKTDADLVKWAKKVKKQRP